MATGFKNVEDSGVSKADLERGFTEGMAPNTDDHEPGYNYPGSDHGEDLGEKGFLGRAKGWER